MMMMRINSRCESAFPFLLKKEEANRLLRSNLATYHGNAVMPFADNSADPRGRPPQIPPQTCFLCFRSLKTPQTTYYRIILHLHRIYSRGLKQWKSETWQESERVSLYFVFACRYGYHDFTVSTFNLLVLFLWIYRSSLDLRISEGMYHDGESTKKISNYTLMSLRSKLQAVACGWIQYPVYKVITHHDGISKFIPPSVNQAPPKLKAQIGKSPQSRRICSGNLLTAHVDVGPAGSGLLQQSLLFLSSRWPSQFVPIQASPSLGAFGKLHHGCSLLPCLPASSHRRDLSLNIL